MPEGLPAYDRNTLLQELELFPRWYLRRHKRLQSDCAAGMPGRPCAPGCWPVRPQQPQVFVHRDFHSCNLLLTADDRIGVIDYQDAVQGPLTYDLASLLWDRYISLATRSMEQWMEQFRHLVAPGTSRRGLDALV